MFKRVSACLVAVSVVVAMTGSGLTARIPKLPAGSTVFIAPMSGFERHFRAAADAAAIQLVFVRTKAQAAYEITGITKEVRPDAEGVSTSRTTRQHTTITITNIDSGEIVFTHSVRTVVHSPNESDSLVHRATRTQTASSVLALGKETAARRCALALRDALNEKP